MYIAKDLIGLYYETDEALLMLVVAYLIILLPILPLARILERRLHHAGFQDSRRLFQEIIFCDSQRTVSYD